ncbi:hypothetical protein LINPERHAP2_LOCUS36194 [Linum perenne]
MREAANITGTVRKERESVAVAGPRSWQSGPMARRERIEPAKEAATTDETSEGERWRSERIRGSKGGMENVETRLEKRENHARWNALI